MLSQWSAVGSVRARVAAHTIHPTKSIRLTTIEFRFPESDLSFFQSRCSDSNIVVSVERVTGASILGAYGVYTYREYRAIATGSTWSHLLSVFQGTYDYSARSRIYEEVVRKALQTCPMLPSRAGRGGWHLPFILSQECMYDDAYPDLLPYLSAMRCHDLEAYPPETDPLRFKKQLLDAHTALFAGQMNVVNKFLFHQMRPRKPTDPGLSLGTVPFGWVPFGTLLAHERPHDDSASLMDTRLHVSGRDRTAIADFVKQLVR